MPSQNAIMIIFPYRHYGAWVFDDERVGLVREPFVSGIPEMIDILVKDIPVAGSGFKLLFSSRPFPGHQAALEWLRTEDDGCWYRWADRQMEGWLCPALFKYFEEAPNCLYLRAEKQTGSVANGEHM